MPKRKFLALKPEQVCPKCGRVSIQVKASRGWLTRICTKCRWKKSIRTAPELIGPPKPKKPKRKRTPTKVRYQHFLFLTPTVESEEILGGAKAISRGIDRWAYLYAAAASRVEKKLSEEQWQFLYLVQAGGRLDIPPADPEPWRHIARTVRGEHLEEGYEEICLNFFGQNWRNIVNKLIFVLSTCDYCESHAIGEALAWLDNEKDRFDVTDIWWYLNFRKWN